MIRIYYLFHRTEAGWRMFPHAFYGAENRVIAKEKLRELAEKYGRDNVALRFVQLPSR
jgi:hypothetical protein